jgi:hypothetical protein
MGFSAIRKEVCIVALISELINTERCQKREGLSPDESPIDLERNEQVGESPLKFKDFSGVGLTM